MRKVIWSKRYGSWMWQAFKLLAKGKRLRGTALDIFGKTEERRMERALIAEYFAQTEPDAESDRRNAGSGSGNCQSAGNDPWFRP
jgi:hypothetical protein